MAGTTKHSLSITDREYGALEQELKDLKHKIRNLQTIIELSGIGTMTKEDVEDFKRSLVSNLHYSKNHTQSISEMEKVVSNLNHEIVRMKIRIYTAFSVIAVIFSVVVWLVDLAFKFTDTL